MLGFYPLSARPLSSISPSTPAVVTPTSSPTLPSQIRFARLNGWPVLVQSESSNETREIVGRIGPSYDGKPIMARRGQPRSITLSALLYNSADADALEATVEGRAHHFPLDFDAHSESGLGPDTVAAGNWSIEVCTQGLTGAGIFGAGYLSVVTEIVWDTLLIDRWTVMYWRAVSNRSSAQHIVVRSDGAKWLNGVRADATATPELIVDLGAVAFTSGDYDDVVVMQFNAADLQVTEFFRWTTERLLAMDVPILDGTARDALSFAGAPTVGGTAQVLRHGGKAGGCIQIDAASEVVSYAASSTHSLNGRSEFSVECWVRPNGTGAAVRVIADHRTTVGWDLDIIPAAGGRLAVRARVETAAGQAFHESPTEPGTDTRDTIAESTWSHVQFSWAQTTGKVELRINGRNVIRAAGHFTDRAGSAPTNDSALTLRLGNTSAGTSPLNGRISGFRINGLRLTDAEVRERYLCGVEGVSGPRPQPCSAFPRLVLSGEIVGARARQVLGLIGDQPVVQRSAKPGEANGWYNNARNLSVTLDEVVDDSLEQLPRPLWSFVLAESHVDGLTLRPDERGLPSATLNAAGSFVVGPFMGARAREFNGSTANRVTLENEHASSLFGYPAVTVLAWARLNNTASKRVIVSLSNAAGDVKLELALSSIDALQIVAKPSTTDASKTFAASGAITEEDKFHLVGGFVDLANDLMGAFIDDAGLALPSPNGFYQSAARTFVETAFGAEGHGASSFIGCSETVSSPWSDDIALVAVYPGVLTAEEVHRIYRAGLRGVVR